PVTDIGKRFTGHFVDRNGAGNGRRGVAGRSRGPRAAGRDGDNAHGVVGLDVGGAAAGHRGVVDERVRVPVDEVNAEGAADANGGLGRILGGGDGDGAGQGDDVAVVAGHDVHVRGREDVRVADVGLGGVRNRVVGDRAGEGDAPLAGGGVQPAG